jgi:hypothetical protein
MPYIKHIKSPKLIHVGYKIFSETNILSLIFKYVHFDYVLKEKEWSPRF